MSLYRALDDAQIMGTLARLRDRIGERFPDSGLSRVAGELLTLGEETRQLAAYIARPHWAIRVGAGVILVAATVVLGLLIRSLRVQIEVNGVAELLQATDAGLSTLVFLGATVFFLFTLEARLKRRRALTMLHQLRSVAHIVDMHQLTKDPERIASAQADTASSPTRTLTTAELGRYLDYCSELLSVISKLAALHVQHFNDPVTLSAVNEIQGLTTALSNKIWQKITLLAPGRQL